MNDLNSICALSVLVMFIILVYKFDSRYVKIEKELKEIKKRMDDLLKAQQNSTPVEAESEALQPVKAIADEPVLSQASVETEPDVVAGNISLNKPKDVRASKRRQVNYEKFIGENLFGKVGILIFVIGVGFFVKYAIDQDWINETFRTILGFLTGAVLLAVAGRLQKNYRTFSSLLAGGAFAVFYLTVAIAFHYYHLFSQTAAFIILIGITVFMSILSVVYDRRELAVISLIGGFLAPFIVSSGEGNYMVLFTYLSVLNLGMFGLSMNRKWGELPLISFVFTYLIMGVFICSSYSSSSVAVSSHLFAFATLFYFIFLLPILTILRVEGQKMSRMLVFVVMTNNFIFLLLGVLFLHNMALPFKSEGLLSLFIAIVNMGLVVWLWKSRKDSTYLVYVLLGLALTFVSITVPIQLDGNFITLCWASEMVLLLWLYIKSKVRVYERAALILFGLTMVSFLVDVYNVGSQGVSGTIFLNSAYMTSLFVGIAMGAFALLMDRYREFFSMARLLRYTPWNAILFTVSVAILYYTFMAEFYFHFQGAIKSVVMLLFTTVAIAILCYAFRKRFPIKKYAILYMSAIGINVLVYLLNIWQNGWQHMDLCPVLLRWLAAVFVIANLYYVARQYYTLVGLKARFTVYLNVLATFLWLTIVRSFLWQVGIEEFSAGFSLSLSMLGFVQMGLGMRLHQKVLRMISLVTFAIVLQKLVFADLWAMPTIGKIIVFIILGLILLILSFLYQRLKGVLFKNDGEESD